MARDANIEARLRRWAQWVSVGEGNGYATMSVIHPDWTPPSPGLTPTLKVGASTDVRETHRMLSNLSMRLANTVVVHYVLRQSLADQARLLECAVPTVKARIDEVHRYFLRVSKAKKEF